MKVENIIIYRLEPEIEFDCFKIKKVKFDLEHINRGWDKQKHDYNLKRRSDYNAADIVDFLHILLSLKLSGKKMLIKLK